MEYTSKSQLARILTESWITLNGYCLACNSDTIVQTPANTQARDFECPQCNHPYELKSSIKPFGRAIVDGAYAAMHRRIESHSVASFLLMRYNDDARVTDLTAVHRSFITEETLLKRKPLRLTAKRAGWVGCYILLKEIPPEGRIPIMVGSTIIPRQESRKLFMAADRLSNHALESRNWSRALLRGLHSLPSSRFTIHQAYSLESELGCLYPNNRHVKAKIRQQLQILRKAGLLIFVSRGNYKLLEGPHRHGILSSN